MKRISSAFTGILIAFLAAGLIVGCQNMPLQPDMNAPPDAGMSTLVPLNRAYIGLAKSVESDTQFVTIVDGGTLGGEQTDSNYVVIPAETLQEDMQLYFTLETIHSDDGTDEVGLGFRVDPVDSDAEVGHIYFQDGKSAELYVNKTWLDGTPSFVKNLDSGETVEGVEDTGTHYKIDVPHFSTWAWYW